MTTSWPIVKKNNRCIICGGGDLTKYLSLGEQAFANSYLTPDQLDYPEPKAPLDVVWCRQCGLVQLGHIVDRGHLFSNYAYFSSTSPPLLDHFDQYAEEICKRFPGQCQRLVFEIASNDGILLKAFKKRGAKVLGIDPAKNIAQAANRDGIETIPAFFNKTTALKVSTERGRAGIISANNVLAHTDEAHEMVGGVKQLLDQNGVFVLQTKYLGDLLEKNEFDTTYHEHVSYFSLLPLMRLMENHDLEIFDVKHVETEGGSLRVFAAHSPSPFPVQTAVRDLLNQETNKGFDRPEIYCRFAERPRMVKEKLIGILNAYKAEGKTIAGYGASAKGVTLLQYCGIGRQMLDYIVDNAPSKQGKYTPGTHIPIIPPTELRRRIPDIVLLLAWNFAPSILEKEKWFSERGGKFIIPIPEPQIV